MDKTIIEKKIKEIKYQQFILQMKDYWSGDDYEQDRKWSREIKELEKELKDIEQR